MQNQKFQQAFEKGNFEEAKAALNFRKERNETGRNRLLFFLNNGLVHHFLGNYDKSFEYFLKADFTAEDLRRNLGLEALSYFINPEVTPYSGEHFELIMIHYYQALNFLYRRNINSALVEARRMNIRLQSLNDRYGSKNYKYNDDGFGHLLMGLIYEMAGDFNNAFIAYRNALEVYETQNQSFNNTPVPLQLKRDLIKTARIAGLRSEAEFFARKFDLDINQPNFNTELIIFWNNGLAPVKDQWTINFTAVPMGNGYVNFVNLDLGLSFPILVSREQDRQNILDTRIFRIAVPRFLHRRPVYRAAEVSVNGEKIQLEIIQNIEAIAFQTLSDRMAKELGQSILRFALKQITEQALRRENQGAGFALSMINAITEKTDTRNWQTLPSLISYARIEVQPGENEITFEPFTIRRSSSKPTTIKVNVPEGRKMIRSITTPDSYPPSVQ